MFVWVAAQTSLRSRWTTGSEIPQLGILPNGITICLNGEGLGEVEVATVYLRKPVQTTVSPQLKG